MQEKNKVLQKNVKEFVKPDQIDLVYKELAIRDTCMIDSAILASSNRNQANTESTVLFVNNHAS